MNELVRDIRDRFMLYGSQGRELAERFAAEVVAFGRGDLLTEEPEPEFLLTDLEDDQDAGTVLPVKGVVKAFEERIAGIIKKGPGAEMKLEVEFLGVDEGEEFETPRGMGWVGDNGLP